MVENDCDATGVGGGGLARAGRAEAAEFIADLLGELSEIAAARGMNALRAQLSAARDLAQAEACEGAPGGDQTRETA